MADGKNFKDLPTTNFPNCGRYHISYTLDSVFRRWKFWQLRLYCTRMESRAWEPTENRNLDSRSRPSQRSLCTYGDLQGLKQVNMWSYFDESPATKNFAGSLLMNMQFLKTTRTRKKYSILTDFKFLEKYCKSIIADLNLTWGVVTPDLSIEPTAVA